MGEAGRLHRKASYLPYPRAHTRKMRAMFGQRRRGHLASATRVNRTCFAILRKRTCSPAILTIVCTKFRESAQKLGAFLCKISGRRMMTQKDFAMQFSDGLMRWTNCLKSSLVYLLRPCWKFGMKSQTLPL